MNRFTITEDSCTTGFHEHVTLDPLKPVVDQLRRRKLHFRSGSDQGNPRKMLNIIAENSSLRIAFGWSFESIYIYSKIMKECIEAIEPQHNIFTMTSDSRCDWLGFMPFNIFQRAEYEDLDVRNLIAFNNDLIDFQVDVLSFLLQNKIFLQHSLMRNNDYRFNYFKARRTDRTALSDAFGYYLECAAADCGVESIEGLPLKLIEEDIGCHYLRHPDLFFELLSFHVLKGNIYE